MIAACQKNYDIFGKQYLKRMNKMIGIKVRGLPQRDLIVTKYPEDGIKISDAVQRKHLLYYLWKLRQYSLAIK